MCYMDCQVLTCSERAQTHFLVCRVLQNNNLCYGSDANVLWQSPPCLMFCDKLYIYYMLQGLHLAMNHSNTRNSEKILEKLIARSSLVPYMIQ